MMVETVREPSPPDAAVLAKAVARVRAKLDARDDLNEQVQRALASPQKSKELRHAEEGLSNAVQTHLGTLLAAAEALPAVVAERDEARARHLPDDPLLDGIDGAHPAWWRGHATAVEQLCLCISRILDCKDSRVGVANEPWEGIRRRLLTLVAERDAVAARARREALEEAAALHEAWAAQRRENERRLDVEGQRDMAAIQRDRAEQHRDFAHAIRVLAAGPVAAGQGEG